MTHLKTWSKLIFTTRNSKTCSENFVIHIRLPSWSLIYRRRRKMRLKSILDWSRTEKLWIKGSRIPSCSTFWSHSVSKMWMIASIHSRWNKCGKSSSDKACQSCRLIMIEVWRMSCLSRYGTTSMITISISLIHN